MRLFTLQRCSVWGVALMLGMVVFTCRAAEPTLDEALSAARRQGCGASRGLEQGFQTVPALDQAARQMLGGVPRERALRAAGYRARKLAQYTGQGRDQDHATWARRLAKKGCSTLMDGTLTDVGSARMGNRIIILLAMPFSPPDPRDQARLAQEVLALTNLARGQARQCGSQAFPAVAPLRLNGLLSAAALGYAEVLAATNHFDHTGLDGSWPGDRVTRVGYRWSQVAENLAAGPTTAREVVEGWLHSPGHCVNLMRPGVDEMGLGFAVNRSSDKGIYWTQLFGRGG